MRPNFVMLREHLPPESLASEMVATLGDADPDEWPDLLTQLIHGRLDQPASAEEDAPD